MTISITEQAVIELGDIDEDLDQFIGRLTKIQKEASDAGATGRVRIYFESYGIEAPDLRVIYTRPETAEEKKARLSFNAKRRAKEKARREAEAVKVEEKERALLTELLKKYAPGEVSGQSQKPST